jgi:RimJ/RimL family protein N-acetyltransferase
MEPTPTLETPRLRLRRPTEADASIITWLCNDIRVARTMAEMPHPYTLAHAFEWIETCTAREPDGYVWTFLMERRERPEVVGAIFLTLEAGGEIATAGYWVGYAHWSQGYTTEALQELLRYGFDDLGLQTIQAWYSQGNPASGRVMAKAGMKFEKAVPNGWSRDGHVTDMIYYTLSSDQWRETASCADRQRFQRENETVH